MFASSSLGPPADNGAHSTERKGLFENDDDGADSLESLHERVKLRQSKKQSEIKALRKQLESAQQQVEELETQLAAVTREKDEHAVTTKECQRIIEKRNKQLMKASERMARHSEQYELQMAEMQTRLAAMTTQCDQLRTDAETTEELGRRERELKEQELQNQLETQNRKHEKTLQAAESRIREQEAANAALAKKVQDLEQKLTAASHLKPSAVQVMASDEYQSLLKEREDAEAISRGLNFQLEKEQQEKKYLRKQLTALQATVGATTAAATAASVGFFPDPLASERHEDADGGAGRQTESDLASFDFSAVKSSAPSSPVAATAAAPPLPATSPEGEGTLSEPASPTRSRSRSRGFSASSVTEETSKPSRRDGKRRSASVQTMKTTLEPPEKPADDKSGGGAGKSVGSSVTFFEKLSSRFKRSSPRNGINTSKADEEVADGVPAAEAVFASPLPPRRAFAHGKVLKERPRMYVAKSPSHHEDESSDSIFGSESSSSDSSDDDENPPPPPPPPITVHEPPALFPPAPPPVHVDIASQLFPSDASADAGSSSSSESSDEEDTRNGDGKPASQFVGLPEARGRKPRALSDISSSSSSSSDDSDSNIGKAPLPEIEIKQVESLSESSSDSSSSSDEDDVKLGSDGNAKVRLKVRGASQDLPSRRRSSRSPTSLKAKEKSRSMSQGDNSHSTSKSRMNDYMEARARKRNEKLKQKQEKEHEESKKKEEYEKEWEKMAQEERERKRKQQQARRNGRRRPASMKAVRVSQMRQQMNTKQQQQKEQKEPQVSVPPHPSDPPRPQGDDGPDLHRPSRRKSESKTSGSDAEDERPPVFRTSSTETPPLPPEPTAADTELYLRQQARLRERHELQMKKKLEADEADLVRGDIHRRVEMWAFGKELLHMILTLDQISSNEGLKKCQLMVVQSPDDDTVRKAYRNIIRVVHPDKLRGATIPEQLEAKELFTVLNQAFERFKSQTS